MGYNVAIVGATGVVGQELLTLFEQRKFPVDQLKLLASARSAGKTMEYGGRSIVLEEATAEAFTGVDIAFFAAGGSVSAALAPAAAEQGTVVIDNTSHFRLEPDVPLVIPEVNPDDLTWHKGIIANPNCSTIIMAVVLAPIHQAAGLKRVVTSTYQAVSGAGAAAMTELDRQVREYLDGVQPTAQVLPVASLPRHYQIAFNLIPQIDVFQEGGYTKEEWKMVKETRKILHLPELAITATTVRVPVFRCHSLSVNIETEKKLTVSEVRELLANSPGISVIDDPETQSYPMPAVLSGSDDVYVGRIREDNSVTSGLNLWIVADQIRKGAALNSLQIAEELIRRGLL